ncbi:MAG TPA: glycoside hydrolase family 3 N-terminal domain-containing protein [Bryobacteraceae bacterium]|nr:glycoside hydrolase family 3 N-terminal domain-containing protein [Bryobacteraceae bacterium]
MQRLFSRLAVLSLCVTAWSAVPAAARKAAKPKPAPTAARGWMKHMTLQQKAAQLVFISFNGLAPNSRSREYQRFVRLVRDTGVGGLVLVNWSNGRVIQRAEPYELAAFLNRIQRTAKVPLLVCGDFERGASMRVQDTPGFPHAMAFAAAGDPELTRYEGRVTAREARALGVQWVFYPVADVNNNPDNPIINIRSFGEDPLVVASHVRAFIEGAHADPKKYVLTSAKHFPGHGDTAVDTHLNMASITSSSERLEKMELVPFRAAVEAGVDSIMSAHIAVPALAPADVPATLSRQVMTELLRTRMGFEGLVVTDALEMGGIAKGFSAGEAAVRALEAGVDVLVMPPDPEAAVKAVAAAVRSGRLSEKRLDESVARVLAAKAKLGLDRARLVDLEAIADEVSAPEAVERAQEVAERAVTLVRNEGGVVPLKAPARTCFLVLAESRQAVGGQAFAAEVKRRAPDARVMTLDPTATTVVLDEAARNAAACDAVVVAAFAPVAAYRGNTALAGEYTRLVEMLMASGKPVTLVALGSPYLLRYFPKVQGYLATYSPVPVSETAAVRALFGEISIRGKLPVTIPGMARYGDGIMVPVRTATPQTSARSVP